MSATMQAPPREIGFPWFDKHAMRDNREIFTFDHDYSGPLDYRVWRGVVWASRADMLEFYASGPHQPGDAFPDFIEAKHFDSWEEAEAWLRG